MTFRHVHLLLAFIPIIASHARADSITLRRSLTAQPGSAITLADAAELEGPAAEALADLIIIESADDLPVHTSGDRRLELALVRDRLDAQPGVNWAFLSLRGSEARVRTHTPTAGLTPRAEPARIATTVQPVTLDQLDPGSIRALAQRVLLRILKVEPEDLRVTWSASDDGLLDQQVSTRTVHVQPIGSSARMPLSVTIYQGDRIASRETVRAGIQVRRTAGVIAKAAPRGTTLTPEHVTRRVMWLDPGTDPASSFVGQVTTRRLEPGAIVETADVSPPLIVERGKVIMLHCIAGAIALKTPARALESGRDGQTIRLEMIRTGKRITARISGTPNGPVRAVLVVSTDEKTHQNQGDQP